MIQELFYAGRVAAVLQHIAHLILASRKRSKGISVRKKTAHYRRATIPRNTSKVSDRKNVPGGISSWFSAVLARELNPKENLWDESARKSSRTYALKFINAVRNKLKQAILYIERNPETVKSITSFPC